MSRSLPTPPLSSLPLSHIQTLATYSEQIPDFTPKEWFDRARHEVDLAIIAERKNKKEEMFIAYSKAFTCWFNTRSHPDFGEVKKADPVWGNRVKDFKEVSGFLCISLVDQWQGIQEENKYWEDRKETRLILDCRCVPRQSQGTERDSQETRG